MDLKSRKSSDEKSDDEKSIASTSTIRSLRARVRPGLRNFTLSESSVSGDKYEFEDKEKEKKREKPFIVDPDVSLEWCDVEVTFRVTKNKQLDCDASFDLFPPPEDISKLPSVYSFSSKKVSNGVPSKSTDDQGKTVFEGKHKCHQCDKSFSKMSYLRNHLLAHPKPKPFKCNLCGWGFHQQDNLIRHMATHPEGNDGIKCVRCSAAFNSRAVLVVHMRETHGEKLPASNTPVTPDSSSPSPIQLKTLTSTEKKMSKLPTVAQVLLGTKSSPINRGPVVSPFLGVKNVVSLGSPSQKSSSPGCRCQTCGKLFLTPLSLKQHSNMHKLQSKQFKCEYCEAKFAQENNLQKHVALSHPTAGHPCKHCSISFRSLPDLDTHLKTAHPLEDIESLEQSDVILEEEIDDEELMDTSNGLPQFRCTVCPQAFDELRFLTHHRKKHSHFKVLPETKHSSSIKSTAS